MGAVFLASVHKQLEYTLFTIFIDSLLAELNIPASAYADELKFIANLVHHRRSLIQANVDRVNDWSKSRGMPLSMEKFLVVHCRNSDPRRSSAVVLTSQRQILLQTWASFALPIALSESISRWWHREDVRWWVDVSRLFKVVIQHLCCVFTALKFFLG